MEYVVYGDLGMIYPKPYSIYLRDLYPRKKWVQEFRLRTRTSYTENPKALGFRGLGFKGLRFRVKPSTVLRASYVARLCVGE